MVLKKLWFLGLIGLMWSCGASHEKGTVGISGEILNPIGGGVVIIEQVFGSDFIVVDSFSMGSKAKFERRLKVDEPGFYRLNLFGRQYVNLILNDTDIEVIAEGNKPNGSFTVKGSKDTDYITEINQLQKDFDLSIQPLNNDFIQANNNGDRARIFELREEYMLKKANYDKALKDKLWGMDNSISAIIGAFEFVNPEEEFPFFDSLANRFEKELPNSRYTKDLIRKVNGLKRLAVGSEAPELSLPNPEGTTIALSSMRGQYLMIDFWAAWCKPCRQENPNVVRMYNKYHDKGFEILGVSLDRKKDAWLKAISDDGLEWPHVSDLKYFNSEAARIYNINAIPATYLIGPDGKIIAKGLRGPTLEAKLEEIFG